MIMSCGGGVDSASRLQLNGSTWKGILLKTATHSAGCGRRRGFGESRLLEIHPVDSDGNTITLPTSSAAGGPRVGSPSSDASFGIVTVSGNTLGFSGSHIMH